MLLDLFYDVRNRHMLKKRKDSPFRDKYENAEVSPPWDVHCLNLSFRKDDPRNTRMYVAPVLEEV